MNTPPSKPMDQDARMDISIRRGIRCYFDVDDVTVTVWGSSWSGMEKVWVDDLLVSARRGWRYTCKHEFEHAGHRYVVVVRTISMLSAHLRIELYRDDELIDSDEMVRTDWQADWRKEARSFAKWLVLGGLTGAIVGFAVKWFS